MGYQEIYQNWMQDPEKFWLELAEAVHWYKKPSKALFDENAPLYEWFSDGQMNACYNAVD